MRWFRAAGRFSSSGRYKHAALANLTDGSVLFHIDGGAGSGSLAIVAQAAVACAEPGERQRHVSCGRQRSRFAEREEPG